MHKRDTLVDFSFLLLLSGFSIYLTLRILHIPITHDEAGTILNFSTQSVWDIVSYRDPVPNNHILHTLLVKLFTELFGFSELVCRLPNLLGGILYVIFGYLIMTEIIKKKSWWAITGLIFLVGNPYLIEFFGLARGYGLSISCMMISIYLLLRGRKKDLTGSLIAGAIAVYVNLTQLNFFIPLSVLIFTLSFNKTAGFNKKDKTFLVTIFLFLILIIAWPIKKMVQTNQFQFWGNQGIVHETLLPLLKSSLLGKNYFGIQTQEILMYIVLTLIILVIAGVVMLGIKKRSQVFFRSEFFLAYLFLGTIVYNYLQQVCFNIPYLNSRTALLFYPLFLLAVFSMFIRMNMDFKWKLILILPFLVFTILHIKSSYNLHSSYEWWFDGDNRRVMQLVEEDRGPGTIQKVVLKCDWIFQPSLTYYAKVKYNNLIEAPPYLKTIDTTEVVDYYYITREDKSEWFDRNYTIVKSFAWDSRFLMKKINR